MTNLSSRVVTCAVLTLAVSLLLTGFPAEAFPQGGTGTITGTVTDPKGLAVPNAKVVILNTDTGIERPALATTDSGVYTATFLQPGHYQVTAGKDGFSTFVRKDLILQVGQILTVDVPLTVGVTSSEITVTGEAPLIEPDRTELSQTVSETLAAGLPLNGRRWENFVLLTPGVTTDGGFGLVSYHGISGLFNNSSVDGVSNQQAFFSEDRGRTSVGYTYSLDAVKEFSVDSSSYSAEFGSAAGGQVNSVTKSGTNDIHGDLFYYLRYPSLNALDPYSKGTAIIAGQTPVQPEHQRQQFGGSVGGPVVKDKLFYFLNYDGQRRSFPIIYTGPSVANGSAALSALSTSGCGGTAVVSGLTSQECTDALGFITGNIGARTRAGNQDIFLGKLDYQVTPNNRLSASFNWMNWKAPNDYTTTPTAAVLSQTTNGSYGTHDRFLVANWNSVISPAMVNDFRFQWSRDFEFYGANAGAPSVTLGSSSIGSAGVIAYGMPNALPRAAFPDEHRLQFADSVSWIHNNHSLKFGLDISPVHELLINLFQGGGIYSYTFNSATVPNASATILAWMADVYGLQLASDLTTNAATCSGPGGVDECIGRHYSAFTQQTDVINPAQLAGKDDFYDVHYGTYVQDAWKVTPNVTLNLGLRWDMQWIPQPAHPYTANPLGLFYTQKIEISKLNFAPRFGFAWQADKNTVIRAGYGMFYANTSNSLYYNTRVENGVVQKTFACNANYTPAGPSYGTPSVCLTVPTGGLAIQSVPAFPNILFAAPGPSLQAPFSDPNAITPTALGTDPSTLSVTSLNIRGQSPNLLEPMVNEGEIGVEHQFPGNVSVSETLMYTRGQHLPTCPDANLAAPGTPIGAATPPSTATFTTAALTTSGGLFGNGQAAPPAGVTVTLPFYTSRANSGIGVISACQSIVHTQYIAGITTVKKQFSRGFEFLANYTLARASDDGQVLGSTGTFSGSSDAVLDPLNQQGEWGYSDYDQRQRFVTSLLYAPTFKVDNSTLDYIVNGFGFGGIITIASPMPVNALMNSSTAPTVGGFAGKDGGATGGVSLNAGNNAGRIPIVSKNFYRGKTQIRDVDFRITRDLKFNERMKLQIIGEAFNLFNHTNVTTVNSTAYAYSGLTLVPQAGFLTTTATSNNLSGARQLQISGKFFF